MYIVDRKIDGIKILELNGKVMGDTTDFKKELEELISEETKIIIDCKALNYINSSGLRIFLSILKDITKKNGKIVISNLTEFVQEIFKQTGFMEMFEVTDTQEEALTKF